MAGSIISTIRFDAPTPRLTFGCPVIDTKFGGGVRCRGITELVSESAAGKTQLVLQLLLAAQLPLYHGGLDGSSIYFQTEKSFPLRRLDQLTENKPHLPVNVMDRVFVMYIKSVEHLIDVLLRMDTAVQSNNIKLITIDSIEGLFRGVFANTYAELSERKTYFYKIASLLKSLSYKYGMAVVVINQVSDVIEGATNSRFVNAERLVTSGRKVKPALGPCWATCVDCRIFLSIQVEHDQEINGIMTRMPTKRIMQIVFAPYIPRALCEFRITRHSVKGIESS